MAGEQPVPTYHSLMTHVKYVTPVRIIADIGLH